MSHFKSHDFLFNRPPLQSVDNREENFIIDVIGNWIPESDILFYGLLNSNYSSNFYKLQQATRIDPKSIYYNTSFYYGEDLIKYLYIKDDVLLDESITTLTDDDISFYTKMALENYHYLPSNETMLRHAIIESLFGPFMKSITLVYPWPVRKIDIDYLSKVIPESLLNKIELRTGNLLDIIKENANTPNRLPYTSIITNSLLEVNELIDNPNIYKTNSAFILLRNHSGNMTIRKVKNNDTESYEFIENGTREILEKILNPTTGLPTTQIRFARYEPILFEEPNFGEYASPYSLI